MKKSELKKYSERLEIELKRVQESANQANEKKRNAEKELLNFKIKTVIEILKDCHNFNYDLNIETGNAVDGDYVINKTHIFKFNE